MMCYIVLTLIHRKHFLRSHQLGTQSKGVNSLIPIKRLCPPAVLANPKQLLSIICSCNRSFLKNFRSFVSLFVLKYLRLSLKLTNYTEWTNYKDLQFIAKRGKLVTGPQGNISITRKRLLNKNKIFILIIQCSLLYGKAALR